MKIQTVKKNNICKMLEISAEKYAKNCVYTTKLNKKVDKKYSLWIRMIDTQKSC